MSMKINIFGGFKINNFFQALDLGDTYALNTSICETVPGRLTSSTSNNLANTCVVVGLRLQFILTYRIY